MSHHDKDYTKALFLAGKRSFLFWELISAHGIYAFVFFFIGFWFATDLNFSTLFLVSLSAALTVLLTFFFRYLLKRPRPKLETSYKPVSKKYGFPSAHASTSFSLATSISLLLLSMNLHAVTIAGVIFLFALAILVSLSRIMVGVHYLTDVLAGSLLGALISYLVITL